MEQFGMFTLFELAIGFYLIYAAIKGDGKLYENEYLSCSREEYIKGLRVLAAITGVIMSLVSGLEFFGVVDTHSTLGWILWVITSACIALMMIYTVRRTDKKAAREGKPTSPSKPENAAKPNHDPLRAAFVFDDEDEEQPKEE